MNRAWIYPFVAALGVGMSHSSIVEARCETRSPAHTVALLELYTSEGCDSCPPADRWLSATGRDEPGADSVVLLALHVDYWDRLGWPDRFASARFTERQQTLARLSRSRAVYTPGVFLNQREFRGWRSQPDFRDTLRAINAKPAGADIRIELDPPSGGGIALQTDFRVRPGAAARQPQGFVALYENRLITDVRAGENRGVKLQHDYVVRQWIGPIDIPGAAQFKRTLALEREWKAKDLGVAAFVQDLASGEILQATALPACIEG